MRGTLRSSVTRAVIVAAAVGGGAAVSVGFVAISDGEPASGALYGLAAAGLCALIAWPAGRFAARRTTAPLEQLGATARSFASGSHHVRAAVDGPREVRIVAEALNQMADQVDRAISELKAEERRKTQFVSDVSHELRTPLTAIKGAAETLLDGDVDPEDQQRFLATIATEADRLSRLANDLLTLQRIEGATGELPLRRVDLRDAVDRAAAMLEPLMEDRGVELEVSGHAPVVLGDRDRLQQVVANLIDNASRIVGEGGHVRVELDREAGFARLAVIDDGPGIPEADLPHLFDRFYRADSSRTRQSGGAGLGLAIVRAIVGAHAGSIDAQNQPEGGSRFIVRLPALDDEDR